MNAQTEIKPSIIGALAKALADVEGAQKNAENPHFKKTYADLSSVIAAIRPVAKHGIWYRQVPKRDPDGALIETFYIHESGDELSAGEMFVPTNKRDPQGFGSAVTYCRRYALQTAFGIATEDDDAEAAMRGAERRDPSNGRQGNGNQRHEQHQDRQQQGPELISEAQWSRIVDILDNLKLNPAPYLDHFKVNNLKQLTSAQAMKVINNLEDKFAEKAKEQTNRAGQSDGGDFNDINPDDVPF
ncbi:hypothetical protein GCM10011349_20310 [Novosphingobium indicum]|uniref:Single-stranded DNA-binding protein n=1 Tax=Novosphingobium indicum TaxID=462949 RepID=A0ABQ2JLQ1_9SPHN|nr:ERF family protein [Novosphingobium indicum]GGN49553.1 hypothetical protein GCM10011349_20310 [Novosphingobium indicum]